MNSLFNFYMECIRAIPIELKPFDAPLLTHSTSDVIVARSIQKYTLYTVN